MKKKLFALVLALVLCLGLLPAAGAAYMGDFDIKDGVLRSYFGGDSELTIPAGVTKIGPYAVSNRPNLTSVTIPSGVTSIEEGAFRSCEKLVSVTIPSSVTSIGTRAFNDCTSLTSIQIPESVTTIESRAFSSCGLTAVTIPDGVTSIGHSVFEECPLTQFTVPASVTDWVANALNDCDALTDITFLGDTDMDHVDNWVTRNLLNKPITIHAPAGSVIEGYVNRQISENGAKCTFVPLS